MIFYPAWEFNKYNMEKILLKFNKDMSDSDFIKYLLKLDNIDSITNMISEYDDDVLADFYDNLYNVCKRQIDNNMNNNTMLVNRNETIGEFMYFLKMI